MRPGACYAAMSDGKGIKKPPPALDAEEEAYRVYSYSLPLIFPVLPVGRGTFLYEVNFLQRLPGLQRA